MKKALKAVASSALNGSSAKWAYCACDFLAFFFFNFFFLAFLAFLAAAESLRAGAGVAACSGWATGAAGAAGACAVDVKGIAKAVTAKRDIKSLFMDSNL